MIDYTKFFLTQSKLFIFLDFYQFTCPNEFIVDIISN